MRCNACPIAGLLLLLLVATQILRIGHALPCSTGDEPPARVLVTQKPEIQTSTFSSSDGLPSDKLVMRPIRASRFLDMQPAMAPQVLRTQLVDYSPAASPDNSPRLNRTRSTRPTVTAPAPSPKIRGHHHHTYKAPSPAPAFAPVPPQIYAPPPKDIQGCKECEDGYANAPSGAPCGCVIPMTARLKLKIGFEKLLTLVNALAKELSDSLLLHQSQVHIVGANAVEQFQDNTDVTVQIVPLADAFDNTTASFLASQIWEHGVKLNESLFGLYKVISVHYPGSHDSVCRTPSLSAFSSPTRIRNTSNTKWRDCTATHWSEP